MLGDCTFLPFSPHTLHLPYATQTSLGIHLCLRRLSLSPSLLLPLISLWMAGSYECPPTHPSKPLLSPSMWLCFKRNPWCGAGKQQRYVDFPESRSLCRVRKEVNERDTVWNHQHILGFEDPIQSLLSLCLSDSVRNISGLKFSSRIF